jgi:hypothetical protein
MTQEALRILAKRSSSAYARGLAALRDDTQQWWADQLARDPAEYDEGQRPYAADAEGLKRFLETEILPWYDNRKRELYYRPQIRAQAFGEAFAVLDRAIEPDGSGQSHNHQRLSTLNDLGNIVPRQRRCHLKSP